MKKADLKVGMILKDSLHVSREEPYMLILRIRNTGFTYLASENPDSFSVVSLFYERELNTSWQHLKYCKLVR